MIADIVKTLLPVIDKFIPDKGRAGEMAHELATMTARGELDLAKGQLEINKQEAAHRSRFVSGWRPFLGWGLAFCFLWQGFGFQLFAFIVTLLDPTYDVTRIPVIQDTTAQTSILFAMLGLGGYRTIEKLQGVSK